jgi:hypothetical protein
MNCSCRPCVNSPRRHRQVDEGPPQTECRSVLIVGWSCWAVPAHRCGHCAAVGGVDAQRGGRARDAATELRDSLDTSDDRRRIERDDLRGQDDAAMSSRSASIGGCHLLRSLWHNGSDEIQHGASPPALVRCHVVGDSSCPNSRATESHNDWTTTGGSPQSDRKSTEPEITF